MIISFIKRKILLNYEWRFYPNELLKHDQITTEKNLEFCIIKTEKKILPGWYMAEIVICGKLGRAFSFLRFNHAKGQKKYDLSFIQNSRKSKRLIYIPCKGELSIEIECPKEHISSVDLLLVRVSRTFAKSRMTSKIERLSLKIKSEIKNHNQISKKPLNILYKKYSSIFKRNGSSNSYGNWRKKFDISYQQSQFKKLKYLPKISILLSVYDVKKEWLAMAIDSVLFQSYRNFELCIVDDFSIDKSIRFLINDYHKKDLRVKVHLRDKNGHISQATNDALSMASGEWIVTLDHDDLLDIDALYWLVDAMNTSPGCKLVYSDEDKVDEAGYFLDPYFKCDWNRDLFYSQNMVSHIAAYRTCIVKKIGGYREGYEGSQDYDMTLRYIQEINDNEIVHVPKILYHWRMHNLSTSFSMDVKGYAAKAGQKSLKDHFKARKIDVDVSLSSGGYRVKYSLPKKEPLVTIIVPTKNKKYLLQKCISSIREKTIYKNYEIVIIDNCSADKDAINYINLLHHKQQAHVHKYSLPFNYSAINNLAVTHAKGDVVILINNDIEVINGDWLSEMVSHVLRPGVGVVGAKLYYPDNTIQHAGVVLGIHGVAGHVHRFLPKDNAGYCGRANLIQSFSAVTGACMAVRKQVYLEVGGMNEELPIACNDIDFCLKVREVGYTNVWTPYAELYHHESASRGFDDTPEKIERSRKEVAYMQKRWGDIIKNDPAYNPNLTLDFEDFSLAWPPRMADYNKQENYE
jgi:O-antigen biosynthesis protein